MERWFPFLGSVYHLTSKEHKRVLSPCIKKVDFSPIHEEVATGSYQSKVKSFLPIFVYVYIICTLTSVCLSKKRMQILFTQIHKIHRNGQPSFTRFVLSVHTDDPRKIPLLVDPPRVIVCYSCYQNLGLGDVLVFDGVTLFSQFL